MISTTSTTQTWNRRARSRRIRSLTGSALAAIALFGAAVTAGAASDPGTEAAEGVVRQTVNDVLAILSHRDWAVEQRVGSIEKIAYARFDFTTMSMLVLARNYRKFSPEQRIEFEEEFKAHLSRSYGSRVDRYEQEKVDITGARMESRGDVTVLTRIIGGQADGIEMNYRLRERDSQWRVIDVVIEGVSLVSSFRSQFKELVNRGGPVLLLERLKDKNARFDTPTT